jgi:hypothetical protein
VVLGITLKKKCQPLPDSETKKGTYTKTVLNTEVEVEKPGPEDVDRGDPGVEVPGDGEVPGDVGVAGVGVVVSGVVVGVSVVEGGVSEVVGGTEVVVGGSVVVEGGRVAVGGKGQQRARRRGKDERK